MSYPFENHVESHSHSNLFSLHGRGRLITTSSRKSVCTVMYNEDDGNTSLKIIEQSSEPNIIIPDSPEKSETYTCQSSINSETAEDSIFNIENMESELDLISNDNSVDDLDNTLDVIDAILRKGMSAEGPIQPLIKEEHGSATYSFSPKKESSPVGLSIIPKRDSIKSPPSPASQFYTPMKEDKNVKTEMFSTPTTKLFEKSQCFKTPVNPASSKKPSCVSIKKTPMKSPSYQHIASPIAAYIKNSPQVPLVINVHPKKPLPGCSSIPKLVKSKSVSNKENINLPSLAYKSAKRTEVINIPEKDKMPRSHWAKKGTSDLPKPLVLKHDRREIYSYRKPLQSTQEDSFANLSLRQADVSLCTQKYAFDKPN